MRFSCIEGVFIKQANLEWIDTSYLSPIQGKKR